MKIHYYEDKVPRTVYGTLDSVWINKASRCISFYVKEEDWVTVTIPIHIKDDIILPHYVVTRIMSVMRDSVADNSIQLEDIALEILTQNTLGCFCEERGLVDNFFDVMVEKGYLLLEEVPAFEFVHDRDVEDYERIMSEDTDEYENYGDYDDDDEDIVNEACGDILDDSEQFPILDTDADAPYNVYSILIDDGAYIPNCVGEPYIRVTYDQIMTHVTIVFATEAFGNISITLDHNKHIQSGIIFNNILGCIADAKESGTSAYLSMNIFE